MVYENEDYNNCGSDDDDAAPPDTHREAQLSFAFMAFQKNSRPDAEGVDIAPDDDAEYDPELFGAAVRNQHVSDDPVLSDLLLTPSIAIFSMVDVVEALKVSGAATTYPGWANVLAYAEDQMAFVHAAVNKPAPVPKPAAGHVADDNELQAAKSSEPTNEHAPTEGSATAPAFKAQADHVPNKHTEQLVYALVRRARTTRRPTINLDGEEAPGNELPRLKRLLSLFEDERGPRRRLLIADQAMIDRLSDLDRIAPSFKKVTALVRRAALLSRMTGTGLVVPPVVLSSPPGVGKSFFCDQIAHAIGSSMTKVAVGAVRDLAILGFEPIWRTANIGFVTKALLACDTASPVFLLDELEKASTGFEKAPLDPLLSLLERENAKSLNDNYLGIPFNFSHIIVFASVNDAGALSGPLRDRFMHIPIARPTREQMLTIARSMLTIRIRSFRGLIAMPDDKVVAALTQYHPRRTARIIDLAFGLMAEADRTTLTVEDVIGAGELIDLDAERPNSMGFVPMRVVED